MSHRLRGATIFAGWLVVAEDRVKWRAIGDSLYSTMDFYIGWWWSSHDEYQASNLWRVRQKSIAQSEVIMLQSTEHKSRVRVFYYQITVDKKTISSKQFYKNRSSQVSCDIYKVLLLVCLRYIVVLWWTLAFDVCAYWVTNWNRDPNNGV